MYTKRQTFVEDANGNVYEVDSFWWSQTGYIVKWTIITSIFFLFFAWFVLGYLHAQRRIKKGLPPLAYHRFLVPRHQRAHYAPQSHFTFYQHPNQHYRSSQNGSYGMQSYPDAPPVYNGELPPTYQPPGATKTEAGLPPPPPPPDTLGPAPTGGPYPEVPLPPRAKTRTVNPFRWLRNR